MEIQITSTTSSYNVALPLKPIGKINITTTVTNDLKVALNWISDNPFFICCGSTSSKSTLCLEVQYYRHLSTWKPAILTLFNSNQCLILQLCHLSPDKKWLIKDLLAPVERFMGSNAERSAVMLEEEYGISVAHAVFEDISVDNIREGGEWLEEHGAKLMMRLMIMKKKKPEIELGAVWEKEKLDEDLVAYATLESYLYYMIAAGYLNYSTSSDDD